MSKLRSRLAQTWHSVQLSLFPWLVEVLKLELEAEIKRLKKIHIKPAETIRYNEHST